jgi:hypothetical protein
MLHAEQDVVGATSVATLLSRDRWSRARAFVLLRRPSYFLFAWPKRKLTKEKGHPAWRLPPIHGRQVREPGPGFSTGLGQLLLRCLNSVIHALACPGEKESTSMSTPLRACRPRLTAAQGPRQSSGPSWPALFRRARAKQSQSDRRHSCDEQS